MRSNISGKWFFFINFFLLNLLIKNDMLTVAVIHFFAYFDRLCRLLGKIKCCVSTSISSLFCGFFKHFSPKKTNSHILH